ncbi:MAG: hypothetical protein V3S07_09455 [Micropepsaceae bacterium]
MHIIPASWSHLHLLVSIFPSIGLVFVLAAYLTGLITNSELTKRICLVLFGLLGLLAIPTYVSGVGSMAALATVPDISQAMMDTHYNWGLVALAVLVAAGAASAYEIWRLRRGGQLSERNLLVVLGLAVATLAVMALVGQNGWEINHIELSPDFVSGGTPQSWSHVHIILNHFPTVGFVIGLALFVTALLKNDDILKRIGLSIFAICALLGAPTYVTGAASMWALTLPPIPEISASAINAHRDMALLTLFGLAFTGGLAWMELWRYRHVGRFCNRALYVVLGFALVTLGIMAETGHRGGLINHPEIRSASDVFPEDAITGFWSPAIETAINNVTWFVPWQTLHFFGYSLLFGSVLFITLRILGLWKFLPYSSVHRVLPLAFFGLLINVFSGMLILLADTYRYVNNTTFAPKIAFIAIGGVATLYFSLSGDLWKLKAGDDAAISAKLTSLLILAAWTGVIMGGRLLPYL